MCCLKYGSAALISVPPTKLDSKQHIYGIAQLLGQIHSRGSKQINSVTRPGSDARTSGKDRGVDNS